MFHPVFVPFGVLGATLFGRMQFHQEIAISPRNFD